MIERCEIYWGNRLNGYWIVITYEYEFETNKIISKLNKTRLNSKHKMQQWYFVAIFFFLVVYHCSSCSKSLARRIFYLSLILNILRTKRTIIVTRFQFGKWKNENFTFVRCSSVLESIELFWHFLFVLVLKECHEPWHW